MFEECTIVDKIETLRTGHVQVRFAILLLKDGIEVSSKWHRVVIEPGGDVDATIALVNADITVRPELKAQPISQEKGSYGVLGISHIKDACTSAQTPDVVQKHHEMVLRSRSIETMKEPTK